jgi:tetratricopeptide (TPR) repeat protein
MLAAREAAVVSASPTAGGEAALWANVGQWRLLRDEPQAALVALKRAESLTPDPLLRGRLQLLQAKALLRLGQTPAATAVLVQAAAATDPRLASPALALLGAARVQQGGTQQGLHLLRRAVEEAPTLQWPERAEAEADLGLAYLLMGDETAGLRWLHQTQETFEATGQHDALFQSLENELAYLEQTQQKDSAQLARHRLNNVMAH